MQLTPLVSGNCKLKEIKKLWPQSTLQLPSLEEHWYYIFSGKYGHIMKEKIHWYDDPLMVVSGVKKLEDGYKLKLDGSVESEWYYDEELGIFVQSTPPSSKKRLFFKIEMIAERNKEIRNK